MSPSASGDEEIKIHISSDLEPLIPQYLENKREDLKILQAALERKDWKTLEEVAHLIKGSGASYGFQSLSTMAMDMESAARKKEFEVISQLIHNFDHFLSHVAVVYK